MEYNKSASPNNCGRHPRWSPSSELVIGGLIALHLAQATYFLLGNNARLGMLGVGFLAIVAGSLLRAGRLLVERGPFLLLALLPMALLAAQTHFLKHRFESELGWVFLGIAASLFLCGIALGYSESRAPHRPALYLTTVATGFGIVAMLLFLRFIETISLLTVARTFADTELNPIAVGYAHMVLCMVFLLLALLARGWILRTVALAAAVTAFGLVVSSASRAILVWGALASIIMILAVLRRSDTIHKRRLLMVAVIGCVAVLVAGGLWLGASIGERAQILMSRWEELLAGVRGEKVDNSLMAREQMWRFYLENPQAWWPFGERFYQGYPHNQWIEWIARFGVIGIPFAMLSMVAIFYAWRVLWSRRNLSTEALVVLGGFLVGYFQSITSLSLEMNRVMWLGYGYLLGIALQPRAMTMSHVSARPARVHVAPRRPAGVGLPRQ
jgi:hypothetical protein